MLFDWLETVADGEDPYRHEEKVKSPDKLILRPEIFKTDLQDRFAGYQHRQSLNPVQSKIIPFMEM